VTAAIGVVIVPLIAVLVIVSGTLNGAGDTRSGMKNVASNLWLVRIPLAFLFGLIVTWRTAGV